MAYVVRKAKIGPRHGGLRAFLKGRLPAYMVPAACVMLDAFRLPQRKRSTVRRCPCRRRRASHPKATAAQRNRAHDCPGLAGLFTG